MLKLIRVLLRTKVAGSLIKAHLFMLCLFSLVPFAVSLSITPPVELLIFWTFASIQLLSIPLFFCLFGHLIMLRNLSKNGIHSKNHIPSPSEYEAHYENEILSEQVPYMHPIQWIILFGSTMCWMGVIAMIWVLF